MIVLEKKPQQIKINKRQPFWSIGSGEQDISLEFYESQEYLVPIHTAWTAKIDNANHSRI